MSDPAYHRDADPDSPPRWAVRRHTDRCFHAVEEVVAEGAIVQGILFRQDEIARWIELDEQGFPACHDQGADASEGS